MDSTITFERWIEAIFDHPVAESPWYWDDDTAVWSDRELNLLTPTLVTTLLSETCERSGEVLRGFSDAQVNQGLRFLFFDEYWYSVTDERVPWLERQRCIRSINTLFADCFALRCSPHLSHLDERGASPLNGVCYMWWDIFPAYGYPNEPSLAKSDAEFLDVMNRTLELKSDACREAALHGLGQWSLCYPKTVATIDAFLTCHADLRPELRRYAQNALVSRIK